jgi:hypothetical protein
MNPVIATPHPMPSERRRYQRHELSLSAVAALPGNPDESVKLLELSRTGFLMRCNGPLGVGEPFAIRLEGIGEFAARAIWLCGSLIGCEFQSKLSAGACSEALLKARPAVKNQTRDSGVEEWRWSDAMASAPTGEFWSKKHIGRIIAASLMFWVTVTLTLLA